MAIPHKKGEYYSYADYLTWDEGERFEIIDGEAFNMSPSPSRRHQEVLRDLATAFTNFLRGKECDVFFAPFDVRLLSENKQDDEVSHIVQPDLSVVCNQEKLDDKGCNGSPDMIIEVLSPSSVKLDRWEKYKLYEKAGVNEYWLVDPINSSVEVQLLTNGQYKFQGVFTEEDIIYTHVLTGMELDLSDIFA